MLRNLPLYHTHTAYRKELHLRCTSVALPVLYRCLVQWLYRHGLGLVVLQPSVQARHCRRRVGALRPTPCMCRKPCSWPLHAARWRCSLLRALHAQTSWPAALRHGAYPVRHGPHPVRHGPHPMRAWGLRGAEEGVCAPQGWTAARRCCGGPELATPPAGERMKTAHMSTAVLVK